MDSGIGPRVRMVRSARGMSIRTLAGLASISKTVLWEFETGQRPLERLSDIDALAEQLGVSRAWLLGQPDQPDTPERVLAHGSGERFRRALADTELGERPAGVTDPEPLPILVTEAHRAHGHLLAGDIASPARVLPGLLPGLYAWVVDGDHAQQADALRGLAIAHAAMCGTAKWCGLTDLSWLSATRGRQCARRLGEATWIAFSDFYVSHAFTPYARSLANSTRALGDMEPHAGDDLLATQVYGMLHLMAAFGAGVIGRGDDVRTHLAEAETIASRTGDRTDLDLYFGPANLGVWKVSIAVEMGEGGRATEIARKHDVRPLGAPGRRSTFYSDLGRAFAQERQDSQALNAFLTAEKLAPEQTRANPLVREAAEHIVRRALRSAAGSDLRAFAQRVGALP
ncbi:MAG TPA: helix-turn-helix transcriptional regulator [Mycobacteriales bacterium]|nr:helix-turn-helix transcriptional regulator [Mycobacteriales bacterium]